MPRRSLAHEGVDGVRDGKPPGARGGFQILGMVRGDWLRLAPQACAEGGAGCWVIAGTWPPPGVSLAPRSLSVCSCSPGSLPLWSSVRSRHPLQSSWLLRAASSTSLLLCVSLRLSTQATSGACSASSWLRFFPGVGRAWGLASPSPFVGAVQAAGLFACVRQFWGRLGRGLGIPRPDAGCRIRYRHVRACLTVLGPSGSGAWHPPTHCWLPPSRPGSRCELRCVFLIYWSVVVTCSRMLYGMLWSHCLFLLFLRLLASPGWCIWCLHGLWARFLGLCSRACWAVATW